MGWTAVPEETEVALQRSEGIALLLGLTDQLAVAVLTLSTRRDLEPLPQKVEALGHLGARVTHVVERTYLGWVVGHENELVTVLLGKLNAATLRYSYTYFLTSRGFDLAYSRQVSDTYRTS